MIADKKFNSDDINLAACLNWQGGSGRSYSLVQEDIDDFVLLEHDLYIIAQGDEPRWIGTASDLIADGASRARFKKAVKVASSVLRLKARISGQQRMRAAWDIEGGHLMRGSDISHVPTVSQSSSNSHIHWL